MAVCKITGGPLQGEYKFDPARMRNTRVAHAVRRELGLRVDDQDKMRGAGLDVLTAFVFLALLEAGHVTCDDWSLVWELDHDQFTLDFTEEQRAKEEAEREIPPSNASVAAGSPDETKPSSGDASEPSSENRDGDPSPIGEPDSPIGATFAPLTSET